MKNTEKTKEQLLVENKELQAKVTELEKIKAELHETSAILQAAAERKLKESEEKFRNLFELLPYGGEVIDTKGNIRTCSSSTANMLGYQVSEMIGKNITEFISSESIPIFKQKFPDLLAGKLVSAEIQLICKDGTILDIMRAAQPILDSSGKVETILALNLDITERKQSEIELKNSDKKFRVLTDNMNVGLVLHGPDTKILFSNPAAGRILGLTREQMKGKEAVDPAWRFIREDGSPMPLEEYPVNIALNSKKQFQDYILGINIPGKNDPTWVSVNTNPVLNEEDEIDFISITFIDITEKMLIEKALKESEERFRTAFESASDCILIWDKDYNYLYANQAAIDHVGTTRDKVIGKNIRDGLGHIPDFMHLWMKRIDKVFQTNSVLEVTDITEMRGEKVYTNSFISPIVDDQNNVTSVCVVYRNISDIMKAEEALRESEKKRNIWIESSPICTKVVDLDFNLQFMSASGIRALKIDDINELYGKPYPLYFFPEPFKIAMAENLKKVKETGKKINMEGLLSDTKGNNLWFHHDIVPVNDDNGKLDYLLVVSAEITERKLAEEILLEEKQFSESLINNLPGVFYLISEEGKFLRWNKKFETATGRSTEEMAQISPIDLFEGEDKHAIAAAIQQVFTHGNVQVEGRFVSKDGKRTPYQFSGVKILSEGAPCLIGIGLDITERKLAEEELAQTKALLSEAEKTGKIGGWVVDLENMTQIWTEQTYRIHELDLDYEPDVSKGLDFYAPSSKPIIEQAFNNTVQTGEPFDLELEFITAKGNNIWVHSVGKAHQVDGVTKAVSGSFQDITKRKISQIELKNHRDNLEEIIKERTAELEKTNKELDSALKVFVGRELTISKLEKRIRVLEGKE